MASFYIPLTGLNADSTALNTIANNLSNMNTTGYKSQSVNFSDLFYQQVGAAGSGDPIQRGSGTQVASIETDFSNGSPNTTGVDTNVALQGNGFFVVSDGGNNLLTRDGDFSLDLNGNLITANGLSVMGQTGRFPQAHRTAIRAGIITVSQSDQTVRLLRHSTMDRSSMWANWHWAMSSTSRGLRTPGTVTIPPPSPAAQQPLEPLGPPALEPCKGAHWKPQT